jgi:hypothetical protein
MTDYKKVYEDLKAFIIGQADELPKDKYKYEWYENGGQHKEFTILLGFVGEASNIYNCRIELIHKKHYSPDWSPEPFPDTEHVLLRWEDKDDSAVMAKNEKEEKRQVDKMKKNLREMFKGFKLSENK